jgi:8-oxo-dGTP pyrophosphatase MutT (NUDIX family)
MARPAPPADSILDAGYDPLSDGALRESARAVRPRDAGTLILVRRDGPAPRLLMGRRSEKHVFMPTKWVFPGGRAERGDARAPSATELHTGAAARLGSRGRALAMAAVRETFEEAGLLLAKPAHGRKAAGPWRAFADYGVLPDLAPLDYVARAITPPYRPRRFDARFFLADASALVSLERLPDCGELEEIAWFTLDEAMALDLPSITRFVVDEVGRRLTEPGRPVPFVRMVRGARRLDWL